MESLTDKQMEVLGFIVNYTKEKGRPPTLRDIMDKFGHKSTNSPRRFLTALEKKGYITIEPKVSRGIKVL